MNFSKSIAIVTNSPAPYRNKVFELLDSRFIIIFCAKKESNRKWELKALNFRHLFLEQNYARLKDGYNFVHNNCDVWGKLKSINPAVVIISGFNPTHIYACIWALVNGAKILYMTDGSRYSESILGFKHKLIRLSFFRFFKAFIVASNSGKELIESYGIAREKIFVSMLCADLKIYNSRAINSFDDREFDVMFCGQLHELKLPFYFLDVCKIIKERSGRCRILICGDGPLRDEVLLRAEQYSLDYKYMGFVENELLVDMYRQVKLLLFTTRLDAWGVVVNESMASGTPVITTPFAGVANELVINGKTGFVLELDSLLWAEKVLEILAEKELWGSLSRSCTFLSQKYNFKDAARGIEDAVSFAGYCDL